MNAAIQQSVGRRSSTSQPRQRGLALRPPLSALRPPGGRLWKIALALLLCVALAGCQQKMAELPNFKPYQSSWFFRDGKINRHPPRGTVARGHLRIDRALFTGRLPVRNPSDAPGAPRVQQGAPPEPEARYADFVDEFPFPITRDILEHGHHRYMIYCVVCHDPLGTGHGKIVERGYTPPPSYHIARLREAPVGHFFAVITEGYGSMPAYGLQIPPRDRWAIAAYIRALQLSQHYPVEQLTPEMRQHLETPDAAGEPSE